MQTREAVEGLHNCRKFSQLPRVLRWGYGNTEKVLYCFYKIFLKDNSTNQGNKWRKILDWKIFSWSTRSYFLPASQNRRLTAYNQSKFVWCHHRRPKLSVSMAYICMGIPIKGLKEDSYMKTFWIKKPNLIAIVSSFLPVWLFSISDAIWAIFQFLGC